jgi:ABC-type antimicrobial peptide transport system permease subunit
MVRDLKRAIVSADTFAEVSGVQTMGEIVGELLYPRRAAASILLACGVLGLLLATIGLYGVMSQSVVQRLKEIGIRSTLGADRRDIVTLVIKEAAGVAVVGALPGLALGAIALRVTTNLVGELPTFDALTFVAVPLIATGVVLLAAFIPARQASRLDPMAILRTP